MGGGGGGGILHVAGRKKKMEIQYAEQEKVHFLGNTERERKARHDIDFTRTTTYSSVADDIELGRHTICVVTS